MKFILAVIEELFWQMILSLKAIMNGFILDGLS